MVSVVKYMRELIPVLLVLAGATALNLVNGYSLDGKAVALKYRSESRPSSSSSSKENFGHMVYENTGVTVATYSSPISSSSIFATIAMSSTSTVSTPTIPRVNRLDKSENPTTMSIVVEKKDLPLPHVVAGVGRGAREATKDPCDSFIIGNDAKHEFYSPNYPGNYPNNTDCIRVLKADKGMLLKLDFRDRFDLEPSEACRFDYLEVRDGEHGYAKRIGQYCDKQYPPEIMSKTRYLWLRFHSDENIEYGGFKAIWSMIPRPTDKGVPPELEPCIMDVTGPQAILNNTDFKDRKDEALKNGVALDCMWRIKVNANQKIQLQFTKFELQKPNECDANFVDVFDNRTEMPHQLRSFCGSIADLVSSKTNVVYVRYYVEPRAMNSTVICLVTAYRERLATERTCLDGEYDCEDARCINETLKCNGEVNCRYRWDEDDATCKDDSGNAMINKEHIIIILVVFSLIMFGMSFAFVFNCVRKLIRDHRIIQEHIRQSRENRLDEIGRKTTPCPLSSTRVDSRDRGGSSESPSVEVAPSKELLPPPPPATSCTALLQLHDYERELMSRDGYEINDIHRSNNASNATQERLQESSEEPETRDNFCQTRESLFDGVIPSRRAPSSSQCSACGCGPTSSCPRHTGVPPPPHGWSLHDPRLTGEPPDYLCTYQRFQSPKPPPQNLRDNFRSPGKYSRQNTIDSNGTTTIGSSKNSSGSVPSSQATSGNHGSKISGHGPDPRYRAEAVIELPEQDRRPFSIESTKSAPDVIATH